MIDILFDFYKKELSIKNIIFSDNKIIYYLLSMGHITLSVLAMLVMAGLRSIGITNNFWLTIAFLLSIFVPLGIMGYRYHSVGNKKARELYQEDIQELSEENREKLKWYSIEIRQIMREDSKKKLMGKMKNYNKTINSEYIHLQAKVAQKRADEIKYKLPTRTIAFTVFFVPVLSNYSKYLFDKSAGIEELTRNFIALSIILLVIFLLIIAIEMLKDDIIETYFNKDYKIMKELEELLNELYMETKIEESQDASIIE